MIKILYYEFMFRWIKFKIWYYETAMSECDPLHQDVPMIVHRIWELHKQLGEITLKRWTH
jgi:hypothetical protein